MDMIESLFTPTFPLGPTSNEVAQDTANDLERFKLLFDKNNKLVSQLNSELSLIIGRTGSGKTTLLASVELLHPEATTIYLPPSDVFSDIVKHVTRLSENVVFPEQVSRMWDFIFWGVIFHYISVNYKDERVLEYCTNLNIPIKLSPPFVVINSMLDTLEQLPPSDWPLPTKIAYIKMGTYSFLQIKQFCIDILQAQNCRIFLLMDSLEDYKLNLPAHGVAVSGLLRILGEFNERKDSNVILRCCLPAERYPAFSDLSSNQLKDFRWGILLHWTAGELAHLSAARYMKYLEHYNPDIYRKHFRRLRINDRKDLNEFWNIVFPYPVINKFGTKETPIAYILRHTQLLPRHILLLMNEIISRSIKMDDGKVIGIDPIHIIAGISDKESFLVKQILTAYANPNFPLHEVTSNVLRELPTVFDWSDFDAVAGRLSKRFNTDRTEMMSKLSEIGAIGRVVDTTDHRYVDGVFEYMLPSRLIFSERDRFCIHPLFTREFNANSNYDGAKAVYTYWSGIVDSELEHWK
jgi:energy-coupling factor transporter ATP-binding protein EcfA2